MADSTARATPVAEEVRRRIVEDIASGALQPDQRLLPERELAESFGVSRSTLRQAVTGLVESGLLRRVPGRAGGTFIAHGKLDRDLGETVGLPKYLSNQGYTSHSRVLSTTVSTASEKARIALNLAPDAMVFDIIRVRFADGKPISLDQAQFPAERFDGLLERPLGGSLYELLDSDFDTRPGTSHERIEVVSATPREAEILDVPADSSLLMISRVTHDEDDVPFEYSKDLFRADRTRIVVHSPGHGIRGAATQRGHRVELRNVRPA